jgi:hypothetical protein
VELRLVGSVAAPSSEARFWTESAGFALRGLFAPSVTAWAVAAIPLRPRLKERPNRINHRPEKPMDDETFNLSIRKFLKMVGINSQREIERAVAGAVAARSIAGTETFPATVTLEVAGLKLRTTFDGEIRLQ